MIEIEKGGGPFMPSNEDYSGASGCLECWHIFWGDGVICPGCGGTKVTSNVQRVFDAKAAAEANPIPESTQQTVPV